MFSKHLPKHEAEGEDLSATYAGVKPEDLTDEEKDFIAKGIFGYCDNHKVLYKKWALHQCLVPMIFPDLGACKERPMDPNYTEIHHG